MWESIAKVLTSDNATDAFHFLTMAVFVTLAVLLILVFLSKKGLVKLNTKHIKIGTDETERNIIRQQVEYAHTFLISLEPKIKDLGAEDYDDYLTKYCLERAYDEVVNWITFNHITRGEHYIEIRQQKLTALMYSLGIKPQYRTQEFKDRMYAWIKELIFALVDIRESFR